MARLPRIWVPDLPQHLVVRGNNRQAIFRSDGDRIFFHRCLAELAEECSVRVHAYVFMGNHVHLLATGGASRAIGRMLQCMGRRYVGYFNYLHGRTGTLWEGRYRSCPVESERYLLTCQRYIELNPVRAGMVSDPAEFLWSSHRCHAFGKGDDLVSPHAVFDEISRDDEERRKCYRALFKAQIEPATLDFIRGSLNTGWPLGSADFRERLQAMCGRRTAPLTPGRKPPRFDSGIKSIGV